MDHDALCQLALTEVAALIAARAISPVEVTDAVLHRIERLDRQLHSYVLVLADEARSAAQAAAQELAAGVYRGPLHGVPIAVKDLCDARGTPTMGGTMVLADRVARDDSDVVARLRAAGSIVIGKLNLTEGAMAGYHPERAVPANPWGADRWSGASSSGSGVATAAGLCFGAIGSDTGGSIRFPSAACGIVGLKPTWGRVSRYGVLALAASLDHIGPMTRSTADAAIMLQAIAGLDAKDPTTLPDPIDDLSQGIDAGVQGIRVGFDEGYVRNGADPELAEAVVAGVRLLEDLGAQIIEVKVPAVEDYLPAWGTICAAEAVVAHESTYPSRRMEYGPWFRQFLDMGARISGTDYAKANTLRAACNGQMRVTFQDIDVLACPSCPAPAHRVTPDMMYGGMDQNAERLHELLRYTGPFNFNGAPTLSVPCGFNTEGLPLSLQFVGHHGGERRLCQLGHAFEQATVWHTRRPVL